MKTLGRQGRPQKVWNGKANEKAKKAEWVTPFSHVHIFLHSTVCFRVPDSCFNQFARSPFSIVSASYNNGELIFKSLQVSLNKKSPGKYHTLRTKQTNQKSNYGCVFEERRLLKFIVEFQKTESTKEDSKKALGKFWEKGSVWWYIAPSRQEMRMETHSILAVYGIKLPAYCWTTHTGDILWL